MIAEPLGGMATKKILANYKRPICPLMQNEKLSCLFGIPRIEEIIAKEPIFFKCMSQFIQPVRNSHLASPVQNSYLVD
jgi:hypothetical protein